MPPSIAQRLEEFKDLPPMPNTLHRILQEMDRISASSESLEAIIKEDPVLAARILKVANSPFYGVAGKVNSISHAIMLLGFDEVRNLVLGLSLTQAFGGAKGFGEVSIKGLWLHSMGVATGSQLIANYLGDALTPDECFTMGLLHDIGRFILCTGFKEDFKRILKIQEENKCTLATAEELHGLSHAEVGAYLAKKWKLGEQMISVVRYHHYPKSAGSDEMACAVVFLADQLCHKLAIGWTSKWLPKGIKLPKCLSLKKEEVQEVAKQIKVKKEDLEQSWQQAVGG